MTTPLPTFQQVLTAAVADVSASGYTSPERIADWITNLRNAAERELGPEWETDEAVKRHLRALLDRFTAGQAMERVPGVARFTVENLKPHLRSELDRRIRAATDLIGLSRSEAVNSTIRRFSGWATSVPPGGDETIRRREVKAEIGKDVAQAKFERRRVATDQGHKLVANISEIVAIDQGAIAATWHSHGEHDRSYDARKEHLARAGKVYLVRDSWAHRQGLVKPSDAGFTDEIDKPAQAPFCRCWFSWISSPRRLPSEMLTEKGRAWVEKGRSEMAAMRTTTHD